MNSKYKIFFLTILLFLFTITSSNAVVPPLPQMPSNYVVDLANIVEDNVELQLNGYLKELEQKTTAQVVILTVLSLEGIPIEEFSITTAHDNWKLGQKGKDNGVLLVIAFKDKKYRFEIGYGLEGVLPDSRVGSIGRQYLVPYFKKGDYSTGVYTATLAVINEIASQEGIKITSLPKLQARTYYERSQKSGGLLQTILALLFIAGAIILFIRHPRLFLLLLLASSLGGRRGGWSSGGGSFGGGGGGSFGGGGASGGW